MCVLRMFLTSPARNVLVSYRYAFQGQEKDVGTGKEAFQLRLWDARIGRWLTTDPAGQYASPYLGMGNNPVIGVDPDGGYVYYYGYKLTEEHFLNVLATVIGSETLKSYILSSTKHLHIGTVDGDRGNGYQGQRLSVGAIRARRRIFLSKERLNNIRGVSDKQAILFGDKFTLEPGRNDLAIVYIDFLKKTVEETIFHEFYDHVFLRDQEGITDLFNQHFEFAGSATGGLDSRLNNITVTPGGGVGESNEDYNYPLDRFLRQMDFNKGSVIFPSQYFFTRDYLNAPGRTKVNCGCQR